MARIPHPTGGTRLTQDSFAHESSVGDLVARHRLGASLHDPSATRQPIWGDFTALSFQRYQDSVIDVQRRFSVLPSAVRRYFSNQPYQLLRVVDSAREGNDDSIAVLKKLNILVDMPVEPAVTPPAPTPPAPTSQEPLRADPEAQPFKKG